MPTQKTILVIEDEATIRQVMIDALNADNFLSLEAKNGQEGVDVALLKHPDLILLDLIMPGMDGMTALKKIREDNWGADVPVIIFTNRSATDEQLVTDMVANKPAYYLVKIDWKIQDVIGKINEILH